MHHKKFSYYPYLFLRDSNADWIQKLAFHFLPFYGKILTLGFADQEKFIEQQHAQDSIFMAIYRHHYYYGY